MTIEKLTEIERRDLIELGARPIEIGKVLRIIDALTMTENQRNELGDALSESERETLALLARIEQAERKAENQHEDNLSLAGKLAAAERNVRRYAETAERNLQRALRAEARVRELTKALAELKADHSADVSALYVERARANAADAELAALQTRVARALKRLDDIGRNEPLRQDLEEALRGR